jgi:hypothetical protein
VFDGLAAPATADRDAATRSAIARGTKVSSKLLLWDEMTPSNRARRLWTFMGVHIPLVTLYQPDAQAREWNRFDSLACASG